MPQKEHLDYFHDLNDRNFCIFTVTENIDFE